MDAAPNTHLTIANLPPDLRGQGEELRDEYFALLGEAGLLTELGEVDLGRLNDLERVKAVDLPTLRAIAKTAGKLAELADPAHQEYRTLRAVFQQDCPFEEFRSAAFTAVAASNGFSPFQWAQVRQFRQENGRMTFLIAITPQGPKGLLIDAALSLRDWKQLTTLPDNLMVMGDLDLEGCTALTSLPDGLFVGGDLKLNGCTALAAIPEGLTVGRSLHLEGCTALTSFSDSLSVGKMLYFGGFAPAALRSAARALLDAGRIMEGISY